MITNATEKSYYQVKIEQAISSLKEQDYSSAQEYLKQAMLEDWNAPEVHNLFGALLEIQGDFLLAIKHYRAAYALDPTYKPVIRNIERITTFSLKPCLIEPDYGDKLHEENDENIMECGHQHRNNLMKKEHENEGK